MTFKTKFKKYLLMMKDNNNWKEIAHSDRKPSILLSIKNYKKLYPYKQFQIWIVRR